jgi:hypothetical protein
VKSASLLFLVVNCLAAGDLTGLVPELTHRIPPRALQALSGSEFAKHVSAMDPHEREQAILNTILAGNIPAFLRNLVPVQLRGERTGGKPLEATIFVAPDYLAIGSNNDFLRIPMNLDTAKAVVDRLGFILPTRKMVNAIYSQAMYHLEPQPLPAGPEMRSTLFYERHNEMVNAQAAALGVPLGALVSGDKKDVVLSNRLITHPGQIAIYGWHRPTGTPIQPLSTVHGAHYADYSHGIRLVSRKVLVDGKLRSMSDVLQDPVLSKVLSDEGPIRNINGLLPYSAGN